MAIYENIKRRDDLDVIVVGAGLAGSVAALRAQELGCATVLVDKAADSACGGNTSLSAGNIHAAERSVRFSRDEVLARLRMVTAGFARDELLEAFADNALRSMAWLLDHDIELEGFADDPHRLVFAPARSRKGLDLWPEAGPHRALRSLQASFVQRSGHIFNNTTALDLIVSGETGNITGIVARDALGLRAINASTVVLADGGFQANAAMRRQYIGPFADRIFRRAAGTGTGDAIRMGLQVRAKLVNMQYFYGHCVHRDAFTNGSLWPWPLFDDLLSKSVIVGQKGLRIVDESVNGVGVANALARLVNPSDYWLVFDDSTWRTVPSSGDGAIPNVRDVEPRGGILYAASTLHELGEKLGVNPVNLETTITEYNDAVRSDCLRVLTPPRQDAMARIDVPPFHAVPIVPAITFTMGGLLIDAAARVLDHEEHPIGGLLAAGGSAGGLQGAPAGGYVGGVSSALIFGLLAGEEASRTRSEGCATKPDDL